MASLTATQLTQLFIVAVVVWAPLLALTCDPLLPRHGVRVQCTTVGIPIDCHDRRMPAGTVAHYSCDSPYFVPHSAAPQEGTLSCRNGSWSTRELFQFHKYTCRLNCGVRNFWGLSSFVINGVVSPSTDWPWHATLFALEGPLRQPLYICGGSLIQPRRTTEFFVLTAAHCVSERSADEILVAMGLETLPSDLQQLRDSQKVQLLHVRAIIRHEAYEGDGSEGSSDVALLRLAESVRLTPSVAPVCLSNSIAQPQVGRVGHVIGFGVADLEAQVPSFELRSAPLPVVPPDKCSSYRVRKLRAHELCAGTDGEQNACFGDSGGGLVINGTDEAGQPRFYLQGVVSHGQVRDEDKKTACTIPTVFMKVASSLDWIGNVTNTVNGGTAGPDAVTTTPTPPTTTEAWSWPSTTEKTTIPVVMKCGRVARHLFSNVRRVIERRNDWPWHVTIFKRPGMLSGNWTLHCLGTLISSPGAGLLVLTAASCVTQSGSNRKRNGTPTAVPTNLFKVVVGLLEPVLENIQVHSADAQEFQVQKIVVHEEFTQRGGYYENNLALIHLKQESSGGRKASVEAMPACLPSSSTLAPAVGDVAHIGIFRPGLIRSGQYNTLAPGLRLARITFPVATNKHCQRVAGSVALSSKEFCAAISPLGRLVVRVGVTGEGVVFPRVDADGTKRFHVEGVANRNSRNSQGFLSPAGRFLVYTRVSEYVDWIQKATSKLINNRASPQPINPRHSN